MSEPVVLSASTMSGDYGYQPYWEPAVLGRG